MTTTAKHSYLARLYEQLVAQARRKPGQTQRADLRHGARISVTVRGSMQYVIFSRQGKPVGDTELVTFRHHLSIPGGARRLPAEGQGDSDGRQYVGYAWEVGEDMNNWKWCLHCERAYKKQELDDNEGWCPYQYCDGSVIDSWNWTRIRKQNPGYPKVPQKGVVYPLYGKSEVEL